MFYRFEKAIVDEQLYILAVGGKKIREKRTLHASHPVSMDETTILRNKFDSRPFSYSQVKKNTDTIPVTAILWRQKIRRHSAALQRRN